MTKTVQLQTEFLNIDLDIYSAKDLTPLVQALDDNVIVLHLSRHKRTWETHLELSKHPTKSPNATIRDFCKLIVTLSRDAKKLWNSAKIRRFNIGIRSGTDQPGFWTVIEPETIKSAAKLNVSIALTIYPAHMEVFEKSSSESSKATPPNDVPQDGGQVV